METKSWLALALATLVNARAADLVWTNLAGGSRLLQSTTNLASGWTVLPPPYQTNDATLSWTISNLTTAPASPITGSPGKQINTTIH
jgi:hypothetical protein